MPGIVGIIIAAAAYLALVATGQSTTLSQPTCLKTERMRVQCFEPGSACLGDGCVLDWHGADGWGSDGERCRPGVPLCKMQFKDVTTGRYVSVYRPLCLVWCEAKAP